MKKLKLCNVHKLALSNEGEGRKPIHIPFGTWAYDDTIDQTLDRDHAEKIAADLAGQLAAGEPGIPGYQGHPDVPEYASKYPDKGALGWIKRILVNEDGMDLEVEWDRDPGKGFGWFSPFWTGDDPGTGATGKRNVIVDGLTSVGLVNNPNIREFRLANEAGDNNNTTNTQEKGNNIMDRKILIEKLGLPPEATDEQIYAAIEAGRKAEAEKAEIETKRAAAEADKGKVEVELDNACQERDNAKKELENCKKDHEAAKTALANEKAQHEKTKQLKTRSAVARLELSNEQRDKSAQRVALVNEKQRAGMSYFDAWQSAKVEKPELFND